MAIVYPAGIPAIYLLVLFMRRQHINPDPYNPEVSLRAREDDPTIQKTKWDLLQYLVAVNVFDRLLIIDWFETVTMLYVRFIWQLYLMSCVMSVHLLKVLVGHLPTRRLLLRGLGVRSQAVLDGSSCVLPRGYIYPSKVLMAGPRDAYRRTRSTEMLAEEHNTSPPSLIMPLCTGGDCNAYHARRPACSGWITAVSASRREQSRRGIYLGHILDIIGWSSDQVRRYRGRRVRLKWTESCP